MLFQWLAPAVDFIASLSKQEMRRYMLVYIGGVVAILGILGYRHYRHTARLQNKLALIRKQYKEVKVILTEAKRIAQQRDRVDTVLKKRSNFLLRRYFENIRNKFLLQANIQDKNIKVTQNSLGAKSKNYIEVRLDAKIENINTKQLVELLEEIEKNDIIYTKYLEIQKIKAIPAINVFITIATLEAKKG